MKRIIYWNVVLCVVILIYSTATVTYALSSDDACGFVMLSDVVPDIIQEIRYCSTYNFIGDRIDGYKEPVALLTREAAEALRQVSDELREKGYRLKIYDAYRPQMAVDHFVRWAQDVSDIRMKPYFYPELNKRVLFEEGYIASRSGHSRGSTLDLTLFDMVTGKEVDMGGTFDYFGELSHPSYTGVTAEQYANRMLLRDAMVAHGFKPLSTEWWHFTLVNEPYPDTYFTFPVNSESVIQNPNEFQIKKGMRGSIVKYYQEQLIRAGFLSGTADGIFGTQTETAVMALQEQHDIEPTGIITNVEAEILSLLS